MTVQEQDLVLTCFDSSQCTTCLLKLDITLHLDKSSDGDAGK